MTNTEHMVNRNKALWLLALITALGAALRLVALGSVPPGLHYDEAVYGLQALDIVHGARPVYFTSFTGREPLYMYIMAVVFRVLGVGTLQLRLTSALIGIATIPLVYWLATTLTNRRVGLLAATFTALSYWHLTVSRNGYPNILIPPIECLSMVCLWRGYRDRRWLWMALGGAFMGLVLYTYLAARFYPITVALFFFYAMVVDRRRFWPNWWRVALAAIACVLVFAPLGIHFLRHPADFVERANQVLVWTNLEPVQIPGVLLGNLAKTLGGLAFEGDPRAHFNLPGKPVFSPVSALLFAVGLGFCLWRWRKAEFALLPIWLVGMCLPAILTSDLMPQGQRMFGIIPAIYIMLALGIDVMWRWVAERNVLLQPVGAVLLAALVVFEIGHTGVTYFGTWGTTARAYYAFHGDHIDLAERAQAEMDAGRDVVIQCREYKHPGIVMEYPELLDAAWVSGGHVMVIPNRDDVRYLVAAESLTRHGKIRRRMDALIEPLDTLADPEGGVAVTVGTIAPETVAEHVSASAVASFADTVEVIDWELPSGVARNEPLAVFVRWRVKLGDQPGVLATHLVDGQGNRWAQYRKMGYFPEHWQPGDTVYQVFEMELPEGIPAGHYAVELVMERESGGLLPVVQDGTMSGISLALGEVELEREGALVGPIGEGAEMAPGLVLVKYDPLPEIVNIGGEMQLWLTWQATIALDEDHMLGLSLADASGNVIWRAMRPIGDAYTTSAWQPGEIVRTAYRLELGELGPGLYSMQAVVGDGDPVELGEMEIGGEPRLFEMPAMRVGREAAFGQDVRLMGYGLDENLALTLVWQAITAPTADYKVFVHLVGEDGVMLAQHDAAPADWARPTKGWVAGEYVIDEHQLTLADGVLAQTAKLYIGMYDADTLQRLPIVGDGADGDGRLLLQEVEITP